jgi:O-antigen ligase
MITLEKIVEILLTVLIATLPFEFRTFPVISNLQWIFVGIAVAGLPRVLRARYTLLQDRRVVMAALFVFVQCLAALAAPDFRANAAKGALRVAAGFVLLCVTLLVQNRDRLMRVWCIAAGLAAVYGLVDYFGFGAPDLFRTADFYVGGFLRLSGSFEYANTAAAFFAMSLPIVWLIPRNQAVRLALSSLVLTALFLTYSRGAWMAIALMLVVWTARERNRSPVLLAGAAVALYAVLALIQPVLIQRLRQGRPEKGLAAEYTPEFNLLRHHPKDMGELTVTVKNTGAVTWFPDGDMPVTLSYHWWETDQKRLASVAAIQTPISHRVHTGESLSVSAVFFTPHEPGRYLLIWDLAQKGRGWFSASGVVPGVVEADIHDENAVWHGNGDISEWLRPQKSVDSSITRELLWKSAVLLTLKNPVLGVGPDNFRLMYGRPLGFSSWDTNIRSNSLYLELLSGSGVMGLLTFILMILSIPRRLNAATLSILVFLVHGAVDVFLMTTPIYFAFWILIGSDINQHLSTPDENHFTRRAQ